MYGSVVNAAVVVPLLLLQPTKLIPAPTAPIATAHAKTYLMRFQLMAPTPRRGIVAFQNWSAASEPTNRASPDSPPSAAPAGGLLASAREEGEHRVGGVDLAEPREDLLERVLVVGGIDVGHRVG